MSEPTPIEVHPDVATLARRGAELIAARARDAISRHGSFSLALSGGRTPWAMLTVLGAQEIDWARVALYQVDERVAPAGDPARNLTQTLASLPEPARARIHAMPVEDHDLDAAAARYAAQLPARLDLVHLGLGPDGHTASLVPGDPVLEVRDRDVALTGPYQGHSRMTLTYPAIDRARELLWLVSGADKRDALARLRAHDTAIPAGHVVATRELILADEDAAGGAHAGSG